MSRHRMVRTMNYEDEFYDEDEEYSRSVEDSYCISPSTAAQFTWNREKNVNFASYMQEEKVINEEEEEDEGEEKSSTSHRDNESLNTSRLQLSDLELAQLNSCLEEARNILGESVSDSIMADVIVRNKFNLEASINQLLCQQDAPKPQRGPRQRRNRSQDAPKPQRGPRQRRNRSQVPSEPDNTNSKGAGQDTTDPDVKTIPGVPSLVTPAKSAVKATVGFQTDQVNKPTPPGSPASTKKSALKLKVQSDSTISSSVAKDVKKPSAKGASANASLMDASTTSKTVLNGGENRTSAVIFDSNLRSAVECMGLEGDKEAIQSTVDAMKPAAATPKSKSKSSKLDVLDVYTKRHGDKELLNLVVIGHVDAGKSTLMGHVLYQLGTVNKKTMHKYEQESKKLGKSSFAFAWVLDETDEERSRGVTMDVAQTRFETEKRIVTLLDAPGHKDFIPNMITGASQADVAILVINATKGEFETGFDAGGQTREHALLARSLGVGQVIVAVNKMDTVEWSEERYQTIVKKIGQFLTKQAGFKESDIFFIPCSGLSGENLSKPATEPKLTSWYQPANTLVMQIDNLKPPTRPIDKPFRLNVSDVFKGVGTGFNVAGRVGSGFVQPADKVLIMPIGLAANIRNVFIDDQPVAVAFAGDHVNLTLSGVDMTNVNIGCCLCDPAAPTKSVTKVRAKIAIFNIDVPLTKGFPVVFHYQAINQPAVIKRLLTQLNRATGEVIKKKPRCLVKNTSAVVEIELERSTCLELYTEFKDLGRFMLRSGGHTIAAGLVEELVQAKSSPNGVSQS